MLEYYVRPFYQQYLVDPVVLRLQHRGNPLVITGLSLLLALAFVAAALMSMPWLALLLLLASGYCDTLDGSLARARGLVSPVGAAADIMADRVVEFLVIFTFYLQQPAVRGVACLLMLGSVLFCVTSFLLVAVFHSNTSLKSFYYSAGLMERAEAFIFFALMLLFPSYFNVIALLFSFLVAITALLRLAQFVQQSQEIDNRFPGSP